MNPEYIIEIMHKEMPDIPSRVQLDKMSVNPWRSVFNKQERKERKRKNRERKQSQRKNRR